MHLIIVAMCFIQCICLFPLGLLSRRYQCCCGLQSTKQHERLQEQMHAAIEAKQHAHSLGAMNAQLRADSVALPAAPMGDMHAGGARTNDDAGATLANAAAVPHDSRKPQCVATMCAQHVGNTMLHWPNLTTLPKQRQSVAQVLLMHAPHSVGILTASAAPHTTPHAFGTAADSALQDVSCTVGVTLRAALTGAATAHTVLEQLVAALPAAVAAASKERHRAAGEPGRDASEGLPSDEAVREGKKRLGALWLVLATVLRCCASECSVQGASTSQMHGTGGLDVSTENPQGILKPTEAFDTVSVQLKRLALLTASSGVAKETIENCPQGANGGGPGHSREGGNAAPGGPQGLGVSAVVAVRWLQAQTEGGGCIADVSTSDDSAKMAEVATGVMQPLCETLRIATHETHALEMLFSVLMFAEVCP